MEVTYGLLSNLVQTKSIERVLAPIASQVSVLVTLEDDGDVSESSEGDRDMVPCAEVVVKAAEKLINVGKQRAQTSSDKEYQSQMSSACEILDLSSSSLYVASQRLSVDSSQDARSKVVQAAKDVLQGTMKVLVVSDDAEIRKIKAVAKLVETNTNRLNAVVTMQELINSFKNFTDSAALLTTLANKRQKDLSHDRQREKIIMALNLLKKSIPTVSVAMQSYVKYPNNPQAQTSKMYVIKQLLSAIKDIKDAVENKFVEEDYLDVEEPGFFVSRIDQLIEALSLDNRAELHDDTENWTESVTRHSMLVAHLCTDEFKDKIIKTCQRMLQLKSRVLHLSVTMKLNPDIEKIREDFEETCEILIDESCELEKNVNLSLLHLVVEVFKETTEPLERLVKAAMYTQEVQGGNIEEIIENLISEFECHADKMCQIASFAAASSTDAQRVRAIRSGVSHLEHLDPDIGPAAFAMAKNSKDKMAVRHVKLLMKQWSFEMNNLVQVLDEMTDPGMFILVSEEKVKEDVSTCRGFIMTCDESGISLMCRSMIGRSRRVCQVAEHIMENHHDAVYRNGLLVYVKQLQKAITGVRAASNNVTSDINSSVAVETLLRRFNHLIDCIGRVKGGLSNENHPDILHPMRKDLRKEEKTVMTGVKREVIPQKKIYSESAGNLRAVSSKNKFLATTCSESRLMSTKAPPVEVDPFVPSKSVLVDEQMVMVKEKKSYSKPHSKHRTYLSDKELSYPESLCRQLVAAAAKGDKQKVNSIGGDLFGWTNHIVDAAQIVAFHCEGDKKKKINELSYEVDELTPQILEKSKYVVLGDKEEENSLKQMVEDWSSKVEKMRVYVDVEIDRWKTIVDRVYDAALSSNGQLLSTEIECMQCHQRAVCDLVTLTEGLEDERHFSSKSKLGQLFDDRDELEGLAVTIATTAEMLQGSVSDIEEKIQLEQRCREWAVKMYCVLDDLEHLTSDLKSLGCNRKVWISVDVMDRKDTDVLEFIETENKRYKELLHGCCLGLEDKSIMATALCQDLDSIHVDIKSTVACKGTSKTANQQSGKFLMLYVPEKLGLLSGKWILKVLHCVDTIHEEVIDFEQPLNGIADVAFHNKSAVTEKEIQRGKSEFQLKISQFSENLMLARQKVLQGIQLSTQFEKKSSVRQTLDELTSLSPQVVEAIKVLSNDTGSKNFEEFAKKKQLWAVKVRQLLVSIQQMTDIKPNLVNDVSKLLKVTAPPKVPAPSSESDDNITTAKVIAGSAYSSGAIGRSASPRLVLPDSQQSGGTEFMPVKADIRSVHEELLQVTSVREENAAAVGQIQKQKWSKRQATKPPSPYKPSSSILAAAKYLEREAEKWEDECNPIVQVAKEMSQQMQHMAEYCKGGDGPLDSHQELVKTALAIAENGQKMLRFAVILSDHCVDDRFSKDLMHYANKIPMVSKQLSILANVQMSSPEDRNIKLENLCKIKEKADKILEQNAQNLMKVVMQTLNAAEAVCIKGLKAPVGDTTDEVNAIILATQWQKKLLHQRKVEADQAAIDDLGLRRIEEYKPPTLTQIFNRN